MLFRSVFVALSLFFLAVPAPGTEPVRPPVKDGPLGMKFVPLPKATFYMGWDGKKGSARQVELKEDFEIAIHTVTQGQWQALMGNNPSYFSREGGGKDQVKDIGAEDLKQFPVESVTWNEVQEFIKKLNKQEKVYQYRLPTEAEWEYACRGGGTSLDECSYHYYLGKPTNDLSSDQANFNGDLPDGKAPTGKWLQRTTKVGSYPPNRLGLYDMHGNVWQWCQDRYQAEFEGRVYRGGGWNNAASNLRAAIRMSHLPSAQFYALGFRLVRVRADR